MRGGTLWSKFRELEFGQTYFGKMDGQDVWFWLEWWGWEEEGGTYQGLIDDIELRYMFCSHIYCDNRC
jgi:hypothetical protein